LRRDIQPAAAPTLRAIVADCQQLFILRCPQVKADIGLKPAATPADIKTLSVALLQCLEDRKKTDGEGKSPVTTDNAALAVSMRAVVSDSSSFKRPYLTLLYAGLLVALGENRLAAKEIDDWITLVGEPESKDWPAKWYMIRARIVLAVVIEELIRSPGEPPSVSVQEYHLDNLADTIERLKSLKAVDKAWKAFIENGYDLVKEDFGWPEWSQGCSLSSDPDEAKLQNGLAYSYLQQHLVFGHRATQHAEYFDRYSTQVRGIRQTVLTINLACLGKPLADQTYATILQVYAEIELANASRIAEVKDKLVVKQLLERAQAAATTGVAIAKSLNSQKGKAPSVFKEDVGQEAAALRDEFVALQNRARRGLQAL